MILVETRIKCEGYVLVHRHGVAGNPGCTDTELPCGRTVVSRDDDPQALSPDKLRSAAQDNWSWIQIDGRDICGQAKHIEGKYIT